VIQKSNEVTIIILMKIWRLSLEIVSPCVMLLDIWKYRSVSQHSDNIVISPSAFVLLTVHINSTIATTLILVELSITHSV
jgi:hypothetical protein